MNRSEGSGKTVCCLVLDLWLVRWLPRFHKRGYDPQTHTGKAEEARDWSREKRMCGGSWWCGGLKRTVIRREAEGAKAQGRGPTGGGEEQKEVI